MKLIENIHGKHVHSRRIHVLSKHLAALIPNNASILDVGCGDGKISALIKELRPDITIHGVEVLVREGAAIDIQQFDGNTLPFDDNHFDCVMFIDVLHHTEDPMILLKEAQRVTKDSIILKDHLKEGLLANTTLRFMDTVGNARYGVALPHNYWKKNQWIATAKTLQMSIVEWKESIGLYPFPLNMIFGRKLHMISRWEKN
jgi:SAM-dependent methyltransferase